VRATTATFSVALQVVGTGRVQFKCECEAFKNGFICAHILASVQTLVEHLRAKEGLTPVETKPVDAWQNELESVFGELTGSKDAAPAKRPPSQRHLLFFSIQERATDRWGVYPYSLPTKSFPNEFWDEESGAAPDAIAKHIRTEKLQRDATGVRAVDASRFPYANASERQAAGLLSAVASLGGYGYYYGSIPAGLYEQVLSLLVGSGSVYYGTETTPLRQRVDICAENAFRPGVQVDTTENGIRVAPVLLPSAQDDSAIALSAEKDKWAFKSPSYLLTGKGKMVPMPAATPDIFGGLIARGEIAVPEVGKSLFVERYLLPLAEVLPISGNAVQWEDANTDSLAPVPRLYLTEQNSRLSVGLRFAYGTQEYPFDTAFPAQALERATGEGGSITLKRVRRDPDAEQARYGLLSGTGGSAFGLKRDDEPGHFTLRARVDPVDFLLHHVPKLAEAGYEVYGDEQLQSVRVNRNKPKIAWNVSSGIDWFDLDAMLDVRRHLRDVRRTETRDPPPRKVRQLA
jgi:non-specific serine/threonine protein kinase